jgi:hypothetical protein
MAKLRVVGGGPPFLKMGAKVLYPAAALDAWIAARPVRTRTHEPDARATA